MSETATTTEAPAEGTPGSVGYEGEDATQPLRLPGEAQEAEAANGEAKPDADPEEERKRERRREAQRIGYLTKQRYAEKARADALEQRLQQIEQQARAQNPNGAQPTREEVEAYVNARAAQLVAQQQHDERFNAWESKAAESYGLDKFRAACKTVADMASDSQRQLLAQVVTDTEGGERAIMELADNPEEAERILALPPHKMALAIAKLGEKPTPAPKPVSNAPSPIRPPAVGRARGEPDPERGDFDAYKRWSSKVDWRR